MYLSSKYEDIYPLHSKIVSDKIAHRAISSRDILKKEEEFLKTFEFQIDFTTHFDFYQVYDDLLERSLKKLPRFDTKEAGKLYKLIKD